jgi:prepilin-type N-terminal cleavage/methylation domain-containing protein
MATFQNEGKLIRFRPDHGKRRFRQAGFSLVEVAIASLVIAIFIASILTTVTSGYAILDRSRETLRANQILQQELETVRTYNWTEMTNSANFGTTNYTDKGISYSVTRSVTNYYNSTNYSTNYMKKVTISVIWTNAPGKVITKDMTTLIVQSGLNDYIY